MNESHTPIFLSKKDAETALNQRTARALKSANEAFSKGERRQKRIAAATSAALFAITLILIASIALQ